MNPLGTKVEFILKLLTSPNTSMKVYMKIITIKIRFHASIDRWHDIDLILERTQLRNMVVKNKSRHYRSLKPSVDSR